MTPDFAYKMTKDLLAHCDSKGLEAAMIRAKEHYGIKNGGRYSLEDLRGMLSRMSGGGN
jgi:hypothetical protein